MKILKPYFLYLFVFAVCISCNPDNSGNAISPATLVTEIPMQPTTSASSIATCEPSVMTPTPVINQNLLVYHFENIQDLPPDIITSGVIVLGDQMENSSFIQTVYLMDGKTGQIITDLPPQSSNSAQNYSFAVSPNRKMLAYYSRQSLMRNLNIVDSKGQVILELLIVDIDGKYQLDRLISGDVYWENTIYWVDNNHIVTEKWPRLMNSREMRSISAILFEPFQGIAREYPPIYPDISNQMDQSVIWDKGGLSLMLFDPTMSRLLYGTIDNDVVLWDLETEKEIFRISASLNNHGPVWSIDGGSFLIPETKTFGQYDLLQITRDGEVKQLTFLTKHFTNPNIQSPRWSSDGEKIAFFVKAIQNPCGNGSSSIYPIVLDINSLESIKLYCIPVQPWTEPIWSPDSNQLLLSVEEGWNEFSTVLLDTNEESVGYISHGYIPMGWMVDDTP